MKNTTNEYISTQSMFLSPNIEDSGVKVTVNDKDISFMAESYELNYDTQIKTDDWKYILLKNNETGYYDIQNTVDTITFDMHFEPNEEYSVVVSYTYQLGGYPNYDVGKRSGNIEYYLTPAAMWKDFSSLTINLHLDNYMPDISSSNLEFKKIGARTYQYVSDTLPKENLEIVIYSKWGHSILLMLYCLNFFCASPFGLIILVGVIFMLCYLLKKKRK